MKAQKLRGLVQGSLPWREEHRQDEVLQDGEEFAPQFRVVYTPNHVPDAPGGSASLAWAPLQIFGLPEFHILDKIGL